MAVQSFSVVQLSITNIFLVALNHIEENGQILSRVLPLIIMVGITLTMTYVAMPIFSLVTDQNKFILMTAIGR